MRYREHASMEIGQLEIEVVYSYTFEDDTYGDIEVEALHRYPGHKDMLSIYNQNRTFSQYIDNFINDVIGEV